MLNSIHHSAFIIHHFLSSIFNPPLPKNLLISSRLSRGLDAEKGKTAGEKTAGHVCSTCPAGSNTLFTQTQSADDLQVAGAIGSRQILEQVVSLGNHLQQAETRGVSLFMRAQVLGQLADALGEEPDLPFRRLGIFVASAK